jgi:hypothetical protein
VVARALAALIVLVGYLAVAAADEVVLVSDPAVMERLEARGLSLGERLGGPRASSAAALAAGPRWAAIARTLTAELQAVRRADPRSGVGVARNAHRLFDARWLAADFTRLELIGVANRIDRRPLVEAGCGETRFIYRLAYTKGGVSSRLPMTVAVDYRADADCGRAARGWQPPAGADLVPSSSQPGARSRRPRSTRRGSASSR